MCIRERSIDFTPASAYLHFEVHPRRPMAELTLTNDDPLYRWYECRYPDGTPIECVSGGGFSTMRDADGVYQMCIRDRSCTSLQSVNPLYHI